MQMGRLQKIFSIFVFYENFRLAFLGVKYVRVQIAKNYILYNHLLLWLIFFKSATHWLMNRSKPKILYVIFSRNNTVQNLEKEDLI
jgi:hypothetical protein